MPKAAMPLMKVGMGLSHLIFRLRGDRIKVRPETLEGADRTEAWNRVVSMAPGHGKYESKTDRQIRIVRLTPDHPAL